MQSMEHKFLRYMGIIEKGSLRRVPQLLFWLGLSNLNEVDHYCCYYDYCNYGDYHDL